MYADLAGDGFELVAAAQDTGGPEVADRYYAEANATFTSLFDVEHAVTALYDLVNVPSGIWIDEEGVLVRPGEVAYSKQWTFGTLVVGDDRYAEALRDWVAKGAASEYALDPEAVEQRLASTNPHRSEADEHFRQAVKLHLRGETNEAEHHFAEAQRLDPANWNYHRQPWSFDPENAGAKWRQKFEELEGRPYYAPADL